MPTSTLPTLADVHTAATRIADHVQHTPVLRSRSIEDLAGCELHFKCENFQRAGAFKFRGACNAVLSLDEAAAARGVVTQSSGNHGAALALACRIRGVTATVVVPEGASKVKIEAIQRNGARIVRCGASQAERNRVAAAVLEETGGSLIHPFDDARVIAGQGTAALELVAQAGALDAVITPVSGGGLLAGTALVVRGLLPAADIVGAEPEGAADAHASLLRGERVTGMRADTLCDGLRAELGVLPFAILREGAEVLLAGEAEIIAAMRLIWERMKIIVEPSSAVALAIVLKHRQHFAGRRVGIILSGGNLDLDALPWPTGRPA